MYIRIRTPHTVRLEDGYATALIAVEARYHAELEAKAELLALYREQLEFQRQQIKDLQATIKAMAQNGSAKYDLRGSHFEGGFAETVHGHQIGSVHPPRPRNTS